MAAVSENRRRRSPRIGGGVGENTHLEEAAIPDAETMPLLERIRCWMRNFRGIALTHPKAFILLAGRRYNTEKAFARYEKGLTVFAELGFDPAQTAQWFRLIGGYASGAGMADVASREAVRNATPLRLEHDAEKISYPHVRAIAPHLKVNKLDAIFERNLGVLIDLLANQLKP